MSNKILVMACVVLLCMGIWVRGCAQADGGDYEFDSQALSKSTAQIDRVVSEAVDIDRVDELELTKRPEPSGLDKAKEPPPDDRTDDWSKFTRTTFGLLGMWGKARFKNLVGSELFRNTKLNPRDTPISRMRRNQLNALLRRLVGQARAFATVFTKAEREQMLFLAETGQIKPLPTPDATEEELELIRESARKRMLIRRRAGALLPTVEDLYQDQIDHPEKYLRTRVPISGKRVSGLRTSKGTYVFDRERGGEFKALDAAHDFLYLEFAGQIVGWFQGQGKLTSEEAAVLLDRVASRSATKLKIAKRKTTR